MGQNGTKEIVHSCTNSQRFFRLSKQTKSFWFENRFIWIYLDIRPYAVMNDEVNDLYTLLQSPFIQVLEKV